MPAAVFIETWGWLVLTDLTSMVIMRERSIQKILTDDDHFIQVGMGLQKIP